MTSIYTIIYYLRRVILFIYNQLQHSNLEMSQPTNAPPTTSTNDTPDISKWKDEFNLEIMKIKNDSSNNPLFTSDRCEQVITSITEAKQKCHADRTKKEINLLKTYEIVRFGDRPKVVKKKSATTEGLAKYYVSFNELFDVIYETHITIGHRRITNRTKALKKKYVNVTEKQVIFIHFGLCRMQTKTIETKEFLQVNSPIGDVR